jgi:competence protein ComEC
MPLVARGALAYALGLLVVQSIPLVPPRASILACAALTMVAIRARRPIAAACLSLLAAGLLNGFSARHAERQCGQRLARGASWVVQLETAAAPGGIARATLGDGRCRARATLMLVTGRAQPGDRAVVRGAASLDARGLMIRRARLVEAHTPFSPAALRARVGARIDRIFGPDAPIVRALVLADMSAVPSEQRDRFASAGLVHMLSVSGLHVAIVALALELLASVARVPRAVARIGTLLLLAVYVAGIGAPAPAVRAAVMLGLLMVCRLLQRATSPWAVLAVGSAAPLVEAATVLDLGWQLSVAGTAALVAGGTLAGRIIPSSWHGRRRALARAATVSVVATVATSPLVAWSFGRVSLLGPITNLVADPLMALLQPLLFLALCLPIEPAERLMSDAAHLLLLAFDAVATQAARIPGAAPTVLPSALAACAAGVSAVAALVACVAERAARALIVVLAGVAVMVVEPLVTPARRMTELHMLDVGQGDALAIRTRAGRWIVIDAGRVWAGGDAGRSTVVPYIAHRGGTVALFVLSHPHADHVGGAASLIAALRPGRFLDPGYVGTTPSYRTALDAVREHRIPWQRVRPGDSLVVDEVVLTTLAPDSAWAAALDDANLASTVLAARVGAVRFLLTGDAEAGEEEWLLARSPEPLAADVLKVAHHGSATSTTPGFLGAVRPRLALVSVGAQNGYGHPDASVVAALYGAGADVLRTDQAGTIVVRTDGRALDVEARGVRWVVPPRDLARLP